MTIKQYNYEGIPWEYVPRGLMTDGVDVDGVKSKSRMLTGVNATPRGYSMLPSVQCLRYISQSITYRLWRVEKG
jgi:hypothetical protein